MCLSLRVEEPKSEVNKKFVPEQQSPPMYLYLTVFEYVFVVALGWYHYDYVCEYTTINHNYYFVDNW